MHKSPPLLLDCTLRDGGYYNAWNFPPILIKDYLRAMRAGGVDIVELGFRSSKNKCFNGACFYTTEDMIESLNVPEGLRIGVMVNASELVGELPGLDAALSQIFPQPASHLLHLVRIACHFHEFEVALPASRWLKDRGFLVGYNLMQIADRTKAEVVSLATKAAEWPLDVLYFADSMGGMDPQQTSEIISWLRQGWTGAIGIHTHDNMGLALANTLRAIHEGVTWVDSTVTGMGRGPGNAKTEYLALEVAALRSNPCSIAPLMELIRKHFHPMQQRYGWGTNTYYYLSGKFGIHPTYIQEMLSDPRYGDEDIFAAIEHLRREGGNKFNPHTLEAARHFYRGEPRGTWNPADQIEGRDVLILGTGPGVAEHRAALERYIRKAKPYVLALNTTQQIEPDLIDARVACHPFRLLADSEEHTRLPQPLITPASMLPSDMQEALKSKQLLDYGMGIKASTFTFEPTYCVLPSSLVIAYALAIATSGQARCILLAGFDGYGADDPRTKEMQELLSAFDKLPQVLKPVAITPTTYSMKQQSVYGM